MIMIARLRTYAVVRPLQPLGVRAAVCAGGRAAGGAARAAHLADGRLDPRRDGGGAQRRDGVQPARRRADGRAESAHRESRAAARRDERRARRSRSSSSRRRCSSSPRARLNPLCFALSPVALAIVFWYSLAKRYTTWTQLFLGLAMAVAPVGGWLAVGGRGGWEPWLLGAGDRHVGRRVRRPVCLPGPRVRSRARPAVDSGPLRRRRRRWRSRARCTSSPIACLLALGVRRAARRGLSRRRRGRRRAAGLRAVARRAPTICRR